MTPDWFQRVPEAFCSPGVAMLSGSDLLNSHGACHPDHSCPWSLDVECSSPLIPAP